MKIRPATPEDEPGARRLSEEAFASLRAVYEPLPEKASQQAARALEGTRIVAVEAGRVVGTVRYALHQGHLHLMGLAVHPRFRERGVARAMVDWVCRVAPAMGCDLVVADTIRETGNVAVFERMGFVKRGEQVATWARSDRYDELHDVRLERPVPSPARGAGSDAEEVE